MSEAHQLRHEASMNVSDAEERKKSKKRGWSKNMCRIYFDIQDAQLIKEKKVLFHLHWSVSCLLHIGRVDKIYFQMGTSLKKEIRLMDTDYSCTIEVQQLFPGNSRNLLLLCSKKKKRQIHDAFHTCWTMGMTE